MTSIVVDVVIIIIVVVVIVVIIGIGIVVVVIVTKINYTILVHRVCTNMSKHNETILLVINESSEL